MRLTGIYKREIFRNDGNDYTVGRVKVLNCEADPKFLLKHVEAGEVTIVGYFSPLLLDMTYHFYGDFIENQYGIQFQVERYEMEMQNDRFSLIQFLSSDLFKGVGKVLAARIVDHLGDQVIEKIIADKNVLKGITGLTPQKIDLIFEGCLINYELEKIMRFLMSHGFGAGISKRIFSQYKENTISLLKENPYRLIDDIPGIGFKRADQFALSLKFDPHSPYRIAASIKYVFSELCYQEGYTYILWEQLLSGCEQFLNQNDFRLSVEEIKENIKQLIKQGEIIHEGERLYLRALYEAEVNLANELFRIAKSDFDAEIDEILVAEAIQQVEAEAEIEYTEKQKQAISQSLLSKITIITGGPGTGKTTVVNGIIKTFALLNKISDFDRDDRIALVAPTGRAAKRLQETTGCEGKTIHRLLGYDRNGYFQYNDLQKLGCKLIICDETSMVDIFLAYYLVRALKDDVQIIFVGDVNQLPSVGPGEVLKNLIDACCFPTIVLDKIHRQQHHSSIIEIAHDINNQVIPKDLFEKKTDRNFILASNDLLISRLEFIVNNALSKGFPIEDIQILAPMYKGNVGIDQINLNLQNLINPKSDVKKEIQFGNKIFRQGDKVIQLVNRPQDFVMNGDIGFVTHVFPEDNEDHVKLIVSFDDLEVKYTETELDQLSLAYCISIHKSQGSEFPIVIVVISKSYSIMLQKKLIYTAVTRAKKSLILLGDPYAFINAIRNNQIIQRQTSLQNRLERLFKTNKILIDGYEFEIWQNKVTPYDFLDFEA